MKNTKKVRLSSRQGFTLIELLIVIAIIGILASVVLVSLNSARQRARDASALSTISSIAPNALICIDSGIDIIAPSDPTAGGGEICDLTTGADVAWPSLANTGGWTYSTASIVSDAAAQTYTITAANDTKGITCTNGGGCQKTGW